MTPRTGHPSATAENPFFETWTTPFGAPPFVAHQARAFHAGLRARLRRARGRDRHDRGPERAADASTTPSSRWRTPAAPCSASTMSSASSVGTDSNDTLLAIERDISPRTAAHWNKVRMNDGAVRAASTRSTASATASASPPSRRACWSAITPSIRREGAGARRRTRRSASPPSSSGWRRSAPRSARTCWPTSSPTRWSSTARPISPACPISSARRPPPRPPERGMTGKHVITLQRSSVEPFLQFSSRRDLREKAFRAWIARGDNGGKTDNKAIIAETDGAADRARQAARLSDVRAIPARRRHGQDAGGGARAAGKGLEAGARGRARRPRRPAGADRARRAATSSSPPGTGAITPRSFASARCDFEESEVKPYFQLDRVIEAAFYGAQKLFGLTFQPVDVPVWHPDVRAWEVRGARRRPRRHLLRRLFRAPEQARRRLDGHLARPGEARRQRPPDRAQRDELQQGRPDAVVVRGRPHAVPRDGPRRCMACCPTSPIRPCPAPAC